MVVAPATTSDIGHRLTREAAEKISRNWWVLLLNGALLVVAGGWPGPGAGREAAAAVARIARDPATARSSILLLAEPGWRGVLPVPAHGAFSKDASPAELVAALRTLATG
jgi:hypothetical protein